jgi:Ca2+-binding EF-hand superfamily protein
MKSIATAMTVALLALSVGIHTAEAKGKGSTKPPAKKTNEVDAYLKAHDTNKNGTIEPTEFQGSKADFTKWDKNADGKLDRGELTAMLKK